jgi:hypothetical protein
MEVVFTKKTWQDNLNDRFKDQLKDEEYAELKTFDYRNFRNDGWNGHTYSHECGLCPGMDCQNEILIPNGMEMKETKIYCPKCKRIVYEILPFAIQSRLLKF